MNHFYSFITTPVDHHLSLHQNNNPNYRIIPQVYCPHCYPIPNTFSLQFFTFRLWTEHIGATSLNSLTKDLFDNLITADLREIHPTNIRPKVIRLLNTLVFDQSFTQEEQLELVDQTSERFLHRNFTLQSRSAETTDSEEERSFEEYHSETRSVDEQIEQPSNTTILRQPTPLLIEFDEDSESVNSEESSQTNSESEQEEPELLNMATTQQVIDAIGNLVLSLNNRNNEKIIIPIRKYKGGDQDPIEWISEFEVAALANGITDARKIQVVRGYLEGAAASWFDEQRNLNNDALTIWSSNDLDRTNFKHSFQQQFRTQQKLDKWQDELETLRQTGSVEQYTNRFNELIRKVDPAGNYPLSYKKRIYRRGLTPVLRKWTTLNDGNTYQDLVDAAKLAEEAEKETEPKANLTQNSSDMVTLATAIQQIASRLDKMENIPPQQPQRYNNRNSQYSPPICYNCGESGHTSRYCNRPYNPDSFR